MHGFSQRLRVIIWAVLFSTGATPCFAQAAGISGAWREAHVKWTKPPAELHLKERQGEAGMLLFAADRRFMLLYGSVIQSRTGEVVSHGDGQVVFLGTWQVDGETLRTDFRLVSRTVSLEGETLPGPVQQETIRLDRKALMFKKRHFLRDPRLDDELSLILHGATARSSNGDSGNP